MTVALLGVLVWLLAAGSVSASSAHIARTTAVGESGARVLTAQDPAGEAGATPSTTVALPAAAPSSIEAPAISGEAISGETLTATTGGGAAVAWGRNHPEQLGAGYGGNYEVSPATVTVLGLSEITAMAAASESSFALLADGTVRSWGENDRGQLGDGSYTNTGTPAAVVEELPGGELRELHGVKAIAAAGAHALALLEDGRVMTWGAGELGQRGNGESGFQGEATAKRHRDVAVEVPGLKEVTAIASGGAADYAVLADGTLMAWGANLKGMLGVGEFNGPQKCVGEGSGKEGLSCSTTPVAVCAVGSTGPCPSGPYLDGVTAVSAGAEIATRDGAAYAVLGNGTVVAWGENAHGQLGTGTSESSDVPLPLDIASLEQAKAVAIGEKVVAVSGGDMFALALLKDGEAIGWGSNGQGELGGTSSEECSKQYRSCSMRPKLVGGLKDVTAISAGASFSLALSGGSVYAFGDNERGQLGIGSTTNTNVPTAIGGLADVGGIAAGDGPTVGEAHSFAVMRSGSQPPPPLLSVTPGTASLELVWTFSSSEDTIRWRRGARGAAQPLDASEPRDASERHGKTGRWSKTVKLTGKQAGTCSPDDPCRYVIDGSAGEELRPEPYVIELDSPGTGIDRHLDATPLP